MTQPTMRELHDKINQVFKDHSPIYAVSGKTLWVEGKENVEQFRHELLKLVGEIVNGERHRQAGEQAPGQRD